MATDEQTVRTLIGDNKKCALNERVGVGDGTNKYFKLDMFPVVSSPTASVIILVTGVAATTATTTFDEALGRVTFTVAPSAGDNILATYEYHALSSGEISDFLSGLTGSPKLAASNAALALAGNASKLFSYTMGEKSVDKKKVAQNLLALSKQLKEQHFELKANANYGSQVFTMKDNTGTPYEGYDSAVAYLPTETD